MPPTQIEIPSIRRPILEAHAAAPDDVFHHAIQRLAGLDSHLNDVVRGMTADSSEAATAITTAVQDHQEAVAAAAAEPPPTVAPKRKAAKKKAAKPVAKKKART